MRTVQEYKKSLQDGRQVYIRGERVKDVVTHPILSIATEHAANLFRLNRDRKLKDLFTMKSPETGDTVSRYFMVPTTPQELLQRGNLVEAHTAANKSVLDLLKAIGTDALFALLVVSRDMDKALKTTYHERVQKFFSHCRENDLDMATAQTDVKGDRSLRPHEQPDPDMYVRIVQRRRDGIVIRGAKAHTTAAPQANEIFVLPTRAMSEADKDYAVACAVPPNAKGVTLICRPMPGRDRSLFDSPVSRTNMETETVTVFDDVFVPWERVFMAGEWQFAGALANTFATFHRHTAVSYKPPAGDILLGAAALAADYNGVRNEAHIREKLAHLVMYTEIVRACRKLAALEAIPSPSGIMVPNPVYTNAGKFYFATNYHEVAKTVQDIAGGLAITAPSEADLKSPAIGPCLDKYLAGRKGASGRERVRLMSLIRDYTASDFGGYNYVVTLHGEGSMAAQLIVSLRDYDVERCVRLAREAMGAP
ncbi:MAG: 4-hydroxybutyryl-CoA dehydratase [Chloroflexi bacterium]|nr:4-hydroxybutyryl-CoA dehydratase [Chloroflexota bacterium]